eukprot:m.493077 g.493077  ORF g.493077 m.493077 type:complete len:192 (+) comp21792_c0_seq1:1528-2103(+)
MHTGLNALEAQFPGRISVVRGDNCVTLPAYRTAHPKTTCDFVHSSSLCEDDTENLYRLSACGAFVSASAMNHIHRSLYFGENHNGQWSRACNNKWILGVECYKDAPFKIQGSQGFVFSGSSAVAAHEYCIGFFHGKCERDDTRLVQRLERRVDVVTESFSNARIQDLKLPTSVTHSKCLLSARDSFDPPTG